MLQAETGEQRLPRSFQVPGESTKGFLDVYRFSGQGPGGDLSKLLRDMEDLHPLLLVYSALGP